VDKFQWHALRIGCHESPLIRSVAETADCNTTSSAPKDINGPVAVVPMRQSAKELVSGISTGRLCGLHLDYIDNNYSSILLLVFRMEVDRRHVTATCLI
jgi:hypothetical protein